MNYAGIIPVDLANGPGIRTSLFVSGCNFHCPDCFNQDQQDFTYGRPFTERAPVWSWITSPSPTAPVFPSLAATLCGSQSKGWNSSTNWQMRFIS